MPKRYRLLSFLSLYLCVMGSSLPAFSQSYLHSYISDYETLKVSLLTTGVGNEPANRFGHTAVRLKNDQIDHVFNWGMFSFEESNFIWRFFKGDLLYWLGGTSFADHIRFTQYEKRHLWEDTLNLTANQKRQLVNLIDENLKPENRKFLYQYWFKNCSTIPRDLIDEILGGAIRKQYTSEITNKTFRDYVHKHLALFPFAVPSLEIIMNGNLDRPISAWEAMFLPENVRGYFLSMPAIDDQGQAIEGLPFVSSSKVLLDFPEDFSALVWDILLLTLPFWLLAMTTCLGFILKRTKLFLRSLGTGLIIWGSVATLFGTVMLVSWMLSNHFDLWHNVNLAIFWPIDCLYILYGWKIIHSRIPTNSFQKLIRVLSTAHIIFLFGIGLLSISGMIMQDISLILGWFGVPMLILWIFTIRKKRLLMNTQLLAQDATPYAR